MAYIRCLHWHLLLIRTGIFLLSCKREKPQARYLKGTEGEIAIVEGLEKSRRG